MRVIDSAYDIEYDYNLCPSLFSPSRLLNLTKAGFQSLNDFIPIQELNILPIDKKLRHAALIYIEI